VNSTSGDPLEHVATSSAQLTLGAPMLQRLMAWAGERFPAAVAVLSFLIYSTGWLSGRALTRPGELSVSALDALAFVGVWAYFLMLRVFDEHKDFARDSVNFPDRVLQRGLVTLGHLKVVGACAIAVQLGVSLLEDHGAGRVTLWWALLMAWSLLMAKEFFAGAWLERRLVLYAFSHQLAMPLLMLWVAQMGAGDRGLPADVAWLCVCGIGFAFALEVARKVRAPGDEREGVDSYTRSLGLRGAPVAVQALLAVAAVSGALLLHGTGVRSAVAFAFVALAPLPGVAACVAFLRRPVTGAAKNVENGTAVAVLVLLIVLSVAILGARGAG
jgi:hypothetical protein